MMVTNTLRILTIVIGLSIFTSSVQAQETGSEVLGAVIREAAAGAIGLKALVQAGDHRTTFKDPTAGLRRRLRLKLWLDWIRSYTALGPHLYLANASESAPADRV
jgi:hypothetical protein